MKWLIVGLLLVVLGLVGWIIGGGAQAGYTKSESRPGAPYSFDPARYEEGRRNRQQESRMDALEDKLQCLQEEYYRRMGWCR